MGLWGLVVGLSSGTVAFSSWNVVSVGYLLTSVLPCAPRPGLAPYAFENTLRENPVFENDEGMLTQVSTLQYPSSSSGSSQTQQSELDTFGSIENIHLSIEVTSTAPPLTG